ncbi:hypothetical protein C1H46_041344 [Malus baccata]|uniref:Uncharacterized protein n=1 Tax=Malus baccata TaxID=106549 RepID=A0A540KG45_MALBA|nr:hypothetical protein C1H46_041344 [Malus baccata]
MNSSQALRPRALEARPCKWLPLLPLFEIFEPVNPRLQPLNPYLLDLIIASDPLLLIDWSSRASLLNDCHSRSSHRLKQASSVDYRLQRRCFEASSSLITSPPSVMLEALSHYFLVRSMRFRDS